MLLAQFLRSGSLAWGAVFAFSSAFLYFRETTGMFSAMPLFAGSVLLPFFFPHNLGTGITTLFAGIFAGMFSVALGVKNLVLIHRKRLLEASAYVLAYVSLLVFFMQAPLGVFLPLWLFTVFVLGLSLYALLGDYRYAFFFALLMGELAWIVSWLPIGFLNATSLSFAVTLFTGESVREKNISNKNYAFLGALIFLILITSRWSL